MAKKVVTKKRFKVKSLHTRAVIAPDTLNETERTVEVVFATETPVKRRYWDGAYNEVLSIDSGAMRMERINNGAPVLDSHRNNSVKTDTLGVVVRAFIDAAKKEARAVLRFSKRADVEPVWQDIKDGIIKNVSVGYDIHSYTETHGENDALDEVRATDWEPYEISMVGVPADFKSVVRKKDTKISKTRIMKKKTKAEIAKMSPTERKAYEKKVAEKQARIKEKYDKLRVEGGAKAVTAERKRVKLINDAFRTAGIKDAKLKRKHIEGGTKVSTVRKEILELMAKESKNNGKEIRNGHRVLIAGEEEVEKRATAISDAILFRANPSMMVDADGKPLKMDEQVKKYRFLSMPELCRQLLIDGGVNVDGRSQVEIVKMALFGQDMHGRSLGNLSGRAYMSISDFPIILGNTINRTLRQAYDLAPRTFQPFCNRGTARDFRPMTRVQTGDTSAFDKIGEGEEYLQGTMGEAKEVYSVLKYGKKIGLTWEMLINDDLSAFGRIPMSIAQMAAQKQSDLVYAILTGNPNMSDGLALFQAATHKNLDSTGAVIDITGLAAGRKAMRLQKSLGGNYLNLSPEFLIVGATLEQVAYQYTSQQYVPTVQANIAPNYNTKLKVIVEPRLDALNSGKSWFLSASPQAIDTIEYSFLEGDGELFTETRLGFDVDGIETKARMVFGCKAIDYRGLYKNVGA